MATTKASGSIAAGLPHTEQLQTVERFTRNDSRTIKYELTVDDPGAYTAPWTTTFIFAGRRARSCSNTSASRPTTPTNLMVGEIKSVDRTSEIVP